MPKSSNKLTTEQLGRLIYEVRDERVMLDSDLASIYGVETKALNRAVKRNRDRFPKDFAFQLSADEWQNLRYQIGTSSSGREDQSLRYQIGTLKTRRGQHRKYLPWVFTEHGAIMAAILSRQNTGKGVWIDCNLFESQVSRYYAFGGSNQKLAVFS